MMGHYDERFEIDFNQPAITKRKRAIKKMARLEQHFLELDQIFRQEFSNDHPFKTCWWDLQKEYIAWQYEEGLIIKDPQLIIDALKGEE